MDWIVALVCFPFVFLFIVAPGGIEEDDGVLSRSDIPSLMFRIFPGLLPEGSELERYDNVFEALFHHPAFGLTAAIILPGLTAWAILYRRTKPERLLTLAVVMLLLFGNFAPIVVALYSYAAWFTDRRKLVGWAVAATAALVIGLWDPPVTWLGVLRVGVGVGMPISLGLWISTRRLLIASLRERAERLEREQQLMAERAVAAERTRIAREMHDVVAHRVSLMVLHAGGLEVSKAEPAVVQTAAQIRDTGHEALTELREVLGVLRDDSETEAPTVPQPVLSDLDRLVEGWRSAGMSVRYERMGSAHALPALQERTGYRVVQEALTNAAKHAPGGPVRVQLVYEQDELVVTVTNGPPAAYKHDELGGDDAESGTDRQGNTVGDEEIGDHDTAGEASAPVSGFGLAGLRERVQLARGTLDVSALPDGSWQVRAVLPENAEHRHAAAPDAETEIGP